MGVPNEKFVENVYSYDDIGSVGFELWTVNAGSIFDNIYVTDSLDKAWEHANAHWGKISEGEKDAQDAYDKVTLLRRRRTATTMPWAMTSTTRMAPTMRTFEHFPGANFGLSGTSSLVLRDGLASERSSRWRHI